MVSTLSSSRTSFRCRYHQYASVNIHLPCPVTVSYIVPARPPANIHIRCSVTVSCIVPPSPPIDIPIACPIVPTLVSIQLDRLHRAHFCSFLQSISSFLLLSPYQARGSHPARATEKIEVACWNEGVQLFKFVEPQRCSSIEKSTERTAHNPLYYTVHQQCG